MGNKAVISLATGLEDAEKVTVALLMAIGAAETGRETVIFLAKEATRLSQQGVATGTACDVCPPLAGLIERYRAAGGRYFVCPICFDSKSLNKDTLIEGAEINGTIPLWKWIGDDNCVTFSY